MFTLRQRCDVIETRMLDSLRLGLNALFAPQTCGLCDRWVLNHRLIPLCDTCRDGLSRITGPVCHYCGTPLPGSLIDRSGIWPGHSLRSFARVWQFASVTSSSTGSSLCLHILPGSGIEGSMQSGYWAHSCRITPASQFFRAFQDPG